MRGYIFKNLTIECEAPLFGGNRLEGGRMGGGAWVVFQSRNSFVHTINLAVNCVRW